MDYESIQELVEGGDFGGAADVAAALEQEYADSELSDIELSTEEYDAEFGGDEFDEREEELSEYWDGDDIDIDYEEYDTGDGSYVES